VRQLEADGVEAVLFLATVLSGSLRTKGQVIEAMREADWSPRAMLLAGGGETSLGAFMIDGNDAAYGYSTSQWNPQLTGADYQNYQGANGIELLPAVGDRDAPAVFADTFKPFLKSVGLDVYWKGDSPMAVWSVVGFQALYVTQKLVELALTSDVRALALASLRLSTPSVFHLLQFDVSGRTIRANDVLMQYRPQSDGKLEHVVIAPYNIGEEAVFPMPTWKERVFEPVQYARSMEKLMIAINALCIGACLLLAALVLRHRQHAVIRSATPSFCLLTILGAVLMLLSNIFHTSVESDSHCQAQVWLLSLGFTMLFSALFIKTFRIWKIFHSTKKLVVVKLKDRDLLLAVAAFLLTDVVINSAWAGVTGMQAHVVVHDVNRPALNELTCDYSDASAYLFAHVGVKGALLLVGMYLTYLVRNTPSQFNESTYIGVCIYNVSVLVCFLVPLLATGVAGREQYLLRAFALMLVAFSTVSILYVPKFISIHKLKNGGVTGGGNTLQVNTLMANDDAADGSGLVSGGGGSGGGGRSPASPAFGGRTVNAKSVATVAAGRSPASLPVDREKRYASLTPEQLRPLPMLSGHNSSTSVDIASVNAAPAPAAASTAVAGRVARGTAARESPVLRVDVGGEIAMAMMGPSAAAAAAAGSSASPRLQLSDPLAGAGPSPVALSTSPSLPGTVDSTPAGAAD